MRYQQHAAHGSALTPMASNRAERRQPKRKVQRFETLRMMARLAFPFLRPSKNHGQPIGRAVKCGRR